MKWRNTSEEYGLVSKLLHWLIAGIMLSLIPIGWYMSGLSDETVMYWRMLALHITLGLTIAFLFCLKMIWFFSNPRPAFSSSLHTWERVAARTVHVIFTLALAIIPVTGYIAIASNGEPVNLYDIVELPEIGRISKRTSDLLYDIHFYVTYSIAALIGLHIAAVLKHQLVDKRSTLSRMSLRETRVQSDPNVSAISLRVPTPAKKPINQSIKREAAGKYTTIED